MRFRNLLPMNSLICDKDQGTSGAGAGDIDDLDEGESVQTMDPLSDNPPTGSNQSPFSHPGLAGMSEQEVADMLAVSRSTVASLRKRADTLDAQLKAKDAVPATPADPKPVKKDPTDFFANPHDEVREIIRQEMRESINPLLADIVGRREESLWTTMGNKYPNFGKYQEAVQAKLDFWNIPKSAYNQDTVTEAFKAVLGDSILEGNDVNVQSMGDGNDAKPNTTPIPQHRPSSHPVRQGNENNTPRELDEEEKKFARIQFRGVPAAKAYELYRSMQDDANVDDDGNFLVDED